jgi:subtilase family serine protease
VLAAVGCGAPTQAPRSTTHASLRIDQRLVVTLEGNVHPLARAEFDQGTVNPDTPLNSMVLSLKSSPSQQAALDVLLAEQQNPASPLFHQWLTPQEFGARFGASDAELLQLATWLSAQGFAVEEIPASRRMIVFSGTVSDVFEAFHAEIHRYEVNGAQHIANNADPQIPEALADLVDGIVSLQDFRHQPQIATRKPSAAKPAYSAGSTHDLFPADFATIYDLNPLYSAETSGAGASIAIAARSNIRLGDVDAFRSIAGLPANTPEVTLIGADPGLAAGDQDEATLDAEWSGAVAPGASVNLVVATSTATTDGVDLAAAYIVNHAVAPVVSVSYGSCEQEMGATELAFYNSLWEQAASEGISVFVASGDAGAAGCSVATGRTGTGTGVNGLCSSPYATCVGGTELDEGADPAQFWAPTNTASYGSALGYIPEQVWNESAMNGGTGLWSSGGGASRVYSQPGWQAALNGTAEANGMRAVPDVSLAAADHDGYFMAKNGSFWIVSGTSAAAPSFAGMMALVVDAMHGAAQGNANPGLYALVNAANRPFHPTLTGNNSVPGVAGFAASGLAYNLATGLGSVDGSLLVSAWRAEFVPEPVSIQPVGCFRVNLLALRCKSPVRPPFPRPGIGAR